MCPTIPGVDDDAEFTSVRECMVSLGFSKEERDTIFRVIAAVLHLGEAQFTPCAREGQDGITVAEDPCQDLWQAFAGSARSSSWDPQASHGLSCTKDSSVSLACELLGLPLEQMRDVLEHKTLEESGATDQVGFIFKQSASAFFEF